jgi:hypothetical protein
VVEKTFRVFALWGAHRQFSRIAGDQPSSVDKGVPELAGFGYEIVSIYPQELFRNLPWLARKTLRGRGLYVLSVLYLLRALRSDDVIYTTDKAWAYWVARLKKWTIIKNTLIFKWAGFDVDWSQIRNNQGCELHRYYQTIVSFSNVIFATSPTDIDCIKANLVSADIKTVFWPTAVDVKYYRDMRQGASGSSSGVVAVGSDHMRDWPLVIEIARRGINTTVLTEDPRAKRLIEDLGSSRPATLTLAFRVGLRRSAEIMANAEAILIATLPNERFSGATTIGVAAALAKPLILDEPRDFTAYGLIHNKSCEIFERGQVESVLAAIRRVQGDAAHARQLGSNIAALADSLDTRHYAAALSDAFRHGPKVQPFASTAVAGDVVHVA